MKNNMTSLLFWSENKDKIFRKERCRCHQPNNEKDGDGKAARCCDQEGHQGFEEGEGKDGSTL
jgi:hypothetical protein